MFKLELSDTQWMELIDGERPGGLTRCCSNVSSLRDCIISSARKGGVVEDWDLDDFKRKLGWVIDGHEIADIPALVELNRQLAIDITTLTHRPSPITED